MITYDILIPTIPHRHDKLCALLAEIDRQWQPGVSVRVYRDNLEASLRDKNQALLESSQARYVSWCDDDDWIAPDYLPAVMAALQGEPDYVGFQVEWSIDGVVQIPVEHSLRHQGWINGPAMLTRDVTALNPVRRDLAVCARWDFPQDHGADKAWAEQVAPLCTAEVFIPRPMYFYRFTSGDSFLVPRPPLAGPLPQLPHYPWLVTI